MRLVPFNILGVVTLLSVKAPISVNVDNNGRCRSRYCKRVYNNGTVSVNVDSNGGDLSRYCQHYTNGSV